MPSNSEREYLFNRLARAFFGVTQKVKGVMAFNIKVAVLGSNVKEALFEGADPIGQEIWGQFLIEAVFLTFAGGIIGVILGWVVSLVVDRMELMTTVVTADIVILAVSVSVGIGLFFGFYPAWNASRLNPIDALRSE